MICLDFKIIQYFIKTKYKNTFAKYNKVFSEKKVLFKGLQFMSNVNYNRNLIFCTNAKYVIFDLI